MANKRSYHPLVYLCYKLDLLAPEHVKEIPRTTLNYWDSKPHTNLHGFNWVKDYYTNNFEVLPIWRSKTFFTIVRMACKVYACYTLILSQEKNISRKLRLNASTIIIVIDSLTEHISLKLACSWFHISTQKYYRWKNKANCTASVLNLCYKTHPRQLTINEVKQISHAVNGIENKNKKLVTIYYQLLRAKLVYCSLGTFYKYASLTRQNLPFRKYKQPSRHFKASRVFEYLHIDTSIVPTLQDGKQRIVFIKDNYSKAILNYTVAPTSQSLYVQQLIANTFKAYQLHKKNYPIYIVSDGGAENKGEVLNWIDGLKSVTKLTSYSHDFYHSNNCVESAFNTFKNEHLNGKIPIDKKDLISELEKFYSYCNNERYPIALYGLSPMEVVEGSNPDPHFFSALIKKSQKDRIIENAKNKRCHFCDN